MAKIFECWFPEEGEEMRASGAYLADSAEEAAAKATAERCRRQVEYFDRVVAVSSLIGDVPRIFEVECRSQPTFHAVEIPAPSTDGGNP